MSIDELRLISNNDLVTIGNHTNDHLITTFTDHYQYRLQVEISQQILNNLIEKLPLIHAYPNGNHEIFAEKILQENGIKYAVNLNCSGINKNIINRYNINRIAISGSFSVITQLKSCILKISFRRLVCNLRRTFY